MALDSSNGAAAWCKCLCWIASVVEDFLTEWTESESDGNISARMMHTANNSMFICTYGLLYTVDASYRWPAKIDCQGSIERKIVDVVEENTDISL